MQIFGFEVPAIRRKQAPPPVLATPSSRGGWWPIVREGFTGAWQKNVELSAEDVLTYTAVYACVTLIASDIAKLRIKLMQRDADGVWNETQNPAYSPLLRKPNRYQNRIKFLEQWLTSKYIHGNAYMLKARDGRGVVVAAYVLDPQLVRPLVAPDGSVYYALSGDTLAQIPSGVTVPASEIIHDVMVPLYHPLCGVSPITACGIAATQGLRIQNNSARFFGNGSQPGGLLTAPGMIDEADRRQIQEKWDADYSGDNQGKVAVLGNGLKFEKLSFNAVDSQLIEQLKWSAENVCSAFKVPAFKIGVGPVPAGSDIESLNIGYYSQCLQNPIECVELLLDEGLGLAVDLGTELDLDELLKMNTPSLVKAAADAIGGGGMSPNEARRRFLNLGPVPGGGSPYLQQQNFSLEALAKRDAQPNPFSTSAAAPPAPAPALPRAAAADVIETAAWSQMVRRAIVQRKAAA
jgi:HK97 family phage portal protein